MEAWIGYIIGQGVYIALRTQNILRSPKSECNTLWAVLRKYGLEWSAGILLSSAGLQLWRVDPNSFWFFLSWLSLPPVPLIWGTALGYGLAFIVLVDSAGERWTVLRRVLKGNGSPPAGKQ